MEIFVLHLLLQENTTFAKVGVLSSAISWMVDLYQGPDLSEKHQEKQNL